MKIWVRIMVSCTFSGHRDVYQANIDVQIRKALDDIMKTDDVITFYTGAMGEFDSK